MNSSEFVLFSGFNSRAVIAFCRAATAGNIPFSIIARGADDPILKTAYASRVVAQREGDRLEFDVIEDSVRAVRAEGSRRKLVYVPSTEYLNRFILHHVSSCRKVGLEVDLVEAGLYNLISDKGTFYDTCAEAGLCVPRQSPDFREIGFPCFAKPLKYFDEAGAVAAKPFLIGTEAELRQSITSNKSGEFVYQEFVKGKSFYLLFYFAHDGSVQTFSQRNLMQQHHGGSVLAAFSADLHSDTVGASYRTLFTRLGFKGFVMVEICECAGNYFMIEANPRLWGPIQLTLDASAGLLEAYFRDYGFNVSSPRTCGDETARYFWGGGLAQTAKAGFTCSFMSYGADQFLRDYNGWMQSDVWMRPDSMGVFTSEMRDNRKVRSAVSPDSSEDAVSCCTPRSRG